MSVSRVNSGHSQSQSSSPCPSASASAPSSPCPRGSSFHGFYHGHGRLPNQNQGPGPPKAHSQNSRQSSLTTMTMTQSFQSQNSVSYAQEAVRIYARLIPAPVVNSDGNGDNIESESGDLHVQLQRRFTVDPSITNLASLRHLVGRAFDLKGDFGIQYETLDDYRNPIVLPMVSDWDLSAAFLGASDPDLKLLIEPSSRASLILDGDGEVDDSSYEVIGATGPGGLAHSSWELIGSGELNLDPMPKSQGMVKNTNVRKIPNSTQNGNSTVMGMPLKIVPNHHRTTVMQKQQQNNQSSVPPVAIPSLNFNTAGLFNTMERWMQKAMTLVEDFSIDVSSSPTRPPLSDTEFRAYLDPSGILLHPRELRWACYHGGIEPGLRKVVWKHLLCVYPEGLSGHGRMEYVRSKASAYYELKATWKDRVQNGMVNEEFTVISNMVRKDVLRTDRGLAFFAGHDDNPNTAGLFNILTTFALNHPSVSYCQGMSDLASPLLVCLGDEAQAYLCFCALMIRLSPNFSPDGIAMSLLFAHLSEGVAHYDPEFWTYLKSIGADDLLFCYRWLLLELKREFAFEDALKMMEVLWASLPYRPGEIPLWEVKYTGTTTATPGSTTTMPSTHSVSIPIPSSCATSCQSGQFSSTASYSKIAAIRRASGSHSWRSRHLARSTKSRSKSTKSSTLTPTHNHKQYFSLDDSISSTESITSSSGIENSTDLQKSRYPKPRPNFFSLDESTLEILSSDTVSSSPFEILTVNDNDNSSNNKTTSANLIGKNPPKKLIKNLREFWSIAPPGQTRDNSNITQAGFHNADEDDVFTPNSENFKQNLDAFSANSEDFTSNPTNPTQRISSRAQITSDSEADSGHPGDEDEGSLEFSGSFNSLPRIKTTKSLPPPLPPPDQFGGGNPFLIFLCLTLLLQHRSTIMRNAMDYNETAMYFDKMVRRHPVQRVLAQARAMYSNYLKTCNAHAAALSAAADINFPSKSIT